MNNISCGFTQTAAGGQESSEIYTTLYQLVEAVNEEIPSGEDELVAMIVDDILNNTDVVSVGN